MTTLSRRRLDWLVRARGPDLATWPADERDAALETMRRSPEARLAFVDALVDEAAPDGDGAIEARMQATLRRSLAPLSRPMRGLLAGALLACIAAGLYLGVASVDPDPTADVFASAQTVSFAALDP